MSQNYDHAIPAFLEEANELLVEMERILIDLEGAQPDLEQLNAMFRAMHTIKGSSGLFGLDPIVHFTHEAENLLDSLRSGMLEFDEELVTLLFQSHDHVEKMLRVIHQPEDLAALGNAELTETLRAFVRRKIGNQDAGSVETQQSERDQQPDAVQDWLLSLRFSPEVLCNGMDPLSFLRYLGTIGRITTIQTVLTRLPEGNAFEPEVNYLRLELIFSGEVDEKKLNDVFEFVREGSQIHIIPLSEAANSFQTLTMGQSLAECAAVAEAWRKMGVDGPQAAIDDNEDQGASPSDESLIEDDSAAPVLSVAQAVKMASGAVVQRAEQKNTKPSEVRFIKVEASKIDNLINLIGELAIAGAAVNLIARNSNHGAQIEAAATVGTLIEQIRAGTLSMRMVQIGEIFSRFPRVVRDVAKELDKDIELHISGADTELDKSMVEKLGDPLMHIVRNAIDHGIEPAEIREQTGKSPVGNVWLNAYHESGSVVIEVADDGGGLRKEKILANAKDIGLIAPDQVLTDAETYKLIFEPGCSTANKISNISGRGVGMDVVKQGIEDLRGTIDIDTAIGEGTHFRIRLPLTLAIIDGFLVQIGKSTFVIPLEVVLECIELPDDIGSDGKHDCLNLRGEVLPVLNLREFFELGSKAAKRQNIVVVNYGESKAGLLVEGLLGEFQTVIKPLGNLFGHLRSISGSTILGTGEVALILDVPSLIEVAIHKESGGYKTNQSGITSV